MSFIQRFAQDERGATAVEYGLIAALIAVVVVAGFTTLGKNVGTTLNKVSGNIGGSAS